MITAQQLGLTDLEQKNGLPPGLLAAVMQAESAGNPKAVSPAGAQGIFQFMPSTAKAYGINPFNPQEAAVGAARMYGDLSKQYDGDVPKMLAAYNWGSGNMAKKGVENMPQETKDYIAKVTASMTPQQKQQAAAAPQQYADAGNVMTDAVPVNEPVAAAPETMDVEMPDGTVIEGVPVGTTKAQIEAKYAAMQQAAAPAAAAPAEPAAPAAAPVVNELQAAPEKSTLGALSDFVGSNIVGAADSASFGLGDEARAAIGAVPALFTSKMDYGDTYDKLVKKDRKGMADIKERNPVGYGVGQVAGAIGTGVAGAATKTGGAVVRAAGSGLLPAATSTAGKLANLGSKALVTSGVGAVQGGLYGAGSANEGDRLEGAGEGAVIGGLVGGAVPVVGSVAGKVAGAVVPKLSKEMQPLVKVATDRNIPMRVDQIAPGRVRNTLQKVSQEIPGSGVDAFEAKQAAAWNRELAKELGLNTDSLNPEAIDTFLKNSNGKFAQALGKRNVTVGKIGIKRLDDIATEAGSTISDDLAEVVRKNAQFMKDNIGTGVLDAKKAASLRSQMLKRVQNAQGGAKPYLSDMVDIIDTAAKRNMPKASADILKQARREWRNYKTVQPLLEKSPDGLINPTELMNQVKASKYITASKTKTGEDGLVDLARVGKLLAKKGGSDTFQKSAMTLGLGGAGVGIGSGAAIPTAAAAVATMGLNRAAQGVNTSQRIVRAAANRGNGPMSKLGGKLGKTIAAPKATTQIIVSPNNPYALPQVNLPKVNITPTTE